MPVYKDKERGTWFCQFYYTDWQGQRKRKTKRGFSKQREAKEYERMFLDKLQSCPKMLFSSLVDLYLDDMQNRLREYTLSKKKYNLKSNILPYFGDMKLCDIKPTTIRTWQNELQKKDFADSTLKNIHVQLSAIFNYAVKYYGLSENPCRLAGSIGSLKVSDDIQFWTLEEYKAFIATVDKPKEFMAFEILYWCGLRFGELRALTKGDFDLENKILSITKSRQRLHGEDIITDPKTPKSKRKILFPDFLCAEIKDYFGKLYDDTPETELFPGGMSCLYRVLRVNSEIAGVQRIRVHDLRHSHASLLIEYGYSPLMIAERLGHESIQTTLDIYSHLYPNKQSELMKTLEDLNSAF